MIRDPITPTRFQHRVYGTLGLTVLLALYLLVGLTGHDPWRGDDARYFGPVLALARGGDWLFPSLAGEPLTDYPPLYFWTAGALAWLSSAFLPLHGGARLASALFVILSIYFTARAAEALYGRAARTPAALLGMGALGLLLHAHETQPLLAVMAMIALTLYGIAEVPRHPLAGALKAGAGSALAFLAGGVAGLLATAPLLPLALALGAECRNPRASGGLLLGLCVALMLAAVWPLLLHLQQPELFALWLNGEWERLAGPALSAARFARLLETSLWFLWPLWPVGCWALWRNRRRLGSLAVVLPLLSVALVVIEIGLVDALSQSDMLPLVPGFALLAAGGVPSLRRGAANALDWFSLMSLAVFGVLVWLAWTAQAYGWPPGLARHAARNAPDFVLTAVNLQLGLGLLISLAWIVLLLRLPRTASRAPANWAIGLTMLWCLAVTLLMPWFNHSRGYRAIVQSLDIAIQGERATLPDACVATTGLPDAMRTSLDYYIGLQTRKVSGDSTPCPLLLVPLDRQPRKPALAREWQPVWEYRRGAGNRQEGFVLLRRVGR